MTEEVNKGRLASGAAAVFFVCVSVALKKRPRGGMRSKSDTRAFLFFCKICLGQINMCIIDQRERDCLIQAKSSSRPHMLV